MLKIERGTDYEICWTTQVPMIGLMFMESIERDEVNIVIDRDHAL